LLDIEPSFTHVDPFEDTERSETSFYPDTSFNRFTHVDPFEDTERSVYGSNLAPRRHVSPTSIRSRILKVVAARPWFRRALSFTHVDPFEDTESLCD